MSNDLYAEDLRPAIVELAGRVLTERQLEIFVLHVFAGHNVRELADIFGVAHQVISEAINGREGRTPGILKRMGEALKKDLLFQQAMAEIKEQKTKEPKGSDFVGWFRGMPPGQFVPMSALLYMNAIADESGRVSIGELYGHMPSVVVNAVLQPLRVMGYIMTDGITISIIKTPLDKQKESVL